jgi:hypothetical protein
MNLREIVWEGVDWILLACEHSNEPLGSIRGRVFLSS